MTGTEALYWAAMVAALGPAYLGRLAPVVCLLVAAAALLLVKGGSKP